MEKKMKERNQQQQKKTSEPHPYPLSAMSKAISQNHKINEDEKRMMTTTMSMHSLVLKNEFQKDGSSLQHGRG